MPEYNRDEGRGEWVVADATGDSVYLIADTVVLRVTSAGAFTTTGALVTTGITATSLDLNGAADIDNAGNTATLTNTTDGASVQVAVFEGDRATPADGDAAYVTFRLSDSAGNQDEGVRLTWQATTVLNGATQDSDLLLAAVNNGSLNTQLTLDGSANQLVHNVGSTFAGTTIADLGTVTTANIDGGTVDGTIIGGAVTAAGSFTAVVATSLDLNGAADVDTAGVTGTYTNTTDGASVQVAVFEGDRATPADNDAAYVTMRLSDSAGNQDEGARITWQATTVLDGATQDTDLLLASVNNGSLNTMLTLDGSANQLVHNVGSTFAGTTIADLGTVTTVNIDGGTVDGTIIGGAATAAGSFTAVVATSLDLNGAADVDTAGVTGTYTNTTDGASVQVAILEGDRATPADGDAAYVTLRLSDSAGNQDEGARITWQATTVLDGATQDTDLLFAAVSNGALTTQLTLDGSANQLVHNVGSTFAGTTIADLGTVTTANIDGGTLDGVIVGGATAAAATVTALTATSLDLNGAADVDVAGVTATLTNTTDGASVQVAVFEGNRATPADGDAAYISLALSDSAGNQDEGARLTWQATTVLNGATQDTDLLLASVNNGSLNTMLTLDGSANQLVVNVGSTFAGTTVANLGIVTTADINGGTLDGVIIGGAATAAATVTALTATSLDLNGAADVDTAGVTGTYTNTTDGASVQVAIFEGDRATVADGDAAYVTLRLSDSAGNQDEGARITWQATTVLDGATQDTDLLLATVNNGALTTQLTLDGSANQLVHNVGSTFAGTTIADLGIVTTADINGGSVDGTTVGAAAASTGRFTTLATTGASTTTLGVGAAGANGTVTSERGMGGFHLTTCTYTYNLAVSGAVNLAGGAAVYVLPAVRCAILHASTDATLTSTGAGGCVGDTPDVGLGILVGSGANALLSGVGANAENLMTGETLGALAAGAGTDLNQIMTAAVAGAPLAASQTVFANFADLWTGADTVNIAGTLRLLWVELD